MLSKLSKICVNKTGKKVWFANNEASDLFIMWPIEDSGNAMGNGSMEFPKGTVVTFIQD